MPKFSTHVALMSPEHRAVSFGPGDEVPEWALDQVGPHVLEGKSQSAKSDDDADSTGDSEPEAAADKAPDFTAPARQSRQRRK